MPLCYSCSKSFDEVTPHRTDVKFDGVGTLGVTTLCEACWSSMSPGERLPFYVRHFKAHRWSYGLKDLQSAVLNEGKSIRPGVTIRLRGLNQ